jgi:hypothetical protein
MQRLYIYNTPVRTSQETHYISATKPNRVILFREIIAVYCENHTEHTNALCGCYSEKLNSLYHNHCREVSTFYGRSLYMQINPSIKVLVCDYTPSSKSVRFGEQLKHYVCSLATVLNN